MLAQKSLFDVHCESEENPISVKDVLHASQDARKSIAARDLQRRRDSCWKSVSSVWQTIIFFANLHAGFSKLIGMFEPIDNAWGAQNLILMTGSIAAITIVIVLIARIVYLYEKSAI